MQRRVRPSDKLTGLWRGPGGRGTTRATRRTSEREHALLPYIATTTNGVSLCCPTTRRPG